MDVKGRLLQAYSEVEKALELDEKTKGSPQKALRAVFDLDRVVGRIAKEEPALLGRMKEIQSAVNEVTKSVKSGNLDQAKARLWEARSLIESYVRSS